MPKETKGQQKGGRSKCVKQPNKQRHIDSKMLYIYEPNYVERIENSRPVNKIRFRQISSLKIIFMLECLRKMQEKTDNSTAAAYSHPLDKLGIVDNEYRQKCKKDKGFCPHKMGTHNTVKDLFQLPIINSAEIKWKEPIDNVNWGYGVKQSFPIFNDDFRNTSKKEEKEKK